MGVGFAVGAQETVQLVGENRDGFEAGVAAEGEVGCYLCESLVCKRRKRG